MSLFGNLGGLASGWTQTSSSANWGIVSNQWHQMEEYQRQMIQQIYQSGPLIGQRIVSREPQVFVEKPEPVPLGELISDLSSGDTERILQFL